jgi:hypothetical protein
MNLPRRENINVILLTDVSKQFHALEEIRNGTSSRQHESMYPCSLCSASPAGDTKATTFLKVTVKRGPEQDAEGNMSEGETER